MAKSNGEQRQDDGIARVNIAVVAQYTKDLSFEAPGSPVMFDKMQKAKPDIQINVNVRAAHGENNLHEVILHIDATCKVENETAFVVELDYAGLVQMEAPNDHIQFLLMVEVPRLLFPFARNIISEVTRDGGFMPLMLGPVDFASMLQNSIGDKVSDIADALEDAAKKTDS